jgi:hypothetical protein
MLNNTYWNVNSLLKEMVTKHNKCLTSIKTSITLNMFVSEYFCAFPTE